MAAKTKEVIRLSNGRGGAIINETYKLPKVADTYWYEAQVMRNRNGMAVSRLQQGTLQATSAIDALDQLNIKAKEIWRGTIVKSKVCEVDRNGVIVATTESKGQRVPLNIEDYDKVDIWEWTSRWVAPSFRTYKG